MVETPPMAENRSHQNIHPLCRGDIRAEHSGFDRVIVQNAQVFPDTETRQELSPSQRPIFQARLTDGNIPAAAEPREDLMPTSVILTFPQTIVVHLAHRPHQSKM